VPVDKSNLQVLLNLAQAYEAEFSPITKKNPSESGLYPLDTNIDEHHPSFLLFDQKIPVGFCIKHTVNNRHDIAEFYVVPTYRLKGHARQFAIEIFKKYPGEWQVQQIKGADQATQFWRATIKAFTKGKFEEAVAIDPYWGSVTRQSFVSQ
jgi:predicted acetyltransferase